VLYDHVRVNLEVYVGDVVTFSDLAPDSWLNNVKSRPSLLERMQRFSSDIQSIESSAALCGALTFIFSHFSHDLLRVQSIS